MASTLPLISGPGAHLANHKFPLRTPSVLRASPHSSSCGPRPRRRSTLRSSSSTSASAYSSDRADGDLGARVPAAAPGAVQAPMRRVIAAAPPTIAPHLCAAACALLGGGDGALAADAAQALAVAHAVLHSRVAGGGGWGELLAGDALLPLAFEILAGGAARAAAPGAVLRAVAEVAAAVGASGAAGGYCEEAEGRGGESAERAVEMTDGRVGECAAACGAFAAAAAGEAETEEAAVGRVRRFGYYAGMMDGMLRRGAAAAKAKEYKERAVAEVAGGGFDAAAAEAAAEMVEAWYEKHM